MAKASDIRAKTPDERSTLLLDLRREQFNLRFQRATGQQEATGRVRQVRRDIARIKTIRHEQAGAGEQAGGSARAGAKPRPAKV